MQVTALDHKVAKWRATSVKEPSPRVVDEDGVLTVRMETDFMRSATAIVAGLLKVEGHTDNERGFVEVRYVASFERLSNRRPCVVDGVRAYKTT